MNSDDGDQFDQIRAILFQTAQRQQENTTAIAQLQAITQENAVAITELRTSIAQLQAITQENAVAITELRTSIEQQAIAADADRTLIINMMQYLYDQQQGNGRG